MNILLKRRFKRVSNKWNYNKKDINKEAKKIINENKNSEKKDIINEKIIEKDCIYKNNLME